MSEFITHNLLISLCLSLVVSVGVWIGSDESGKSIGTLPSNKLLSDTICYLPVAIIILFTAGLFMPATKLGQFLIPMVHEDPNIREHELVELTSFFLFLFSGIAGIVLCTRENLYPLKRVFFALFALGMILLAGEESSWGQWIYPYETPEWIRRYNSQGEMTMHNMGGMSGYNSTLRFAFGFFGLIGLVAPLGWMKVLRVPSCLAPSLVIITVYAFFDFMGKRGLLPHGGNYFSRMAEVVEMFTGFVGLVYVLLHLRARQELRACRKSLALTAG